MFSSYQTLILSVILILIVLKLISDLFVKWFKQKDEINPATGLPKNMTLYRCGHHLGKDSDCGRLAVIFAWLLASNKHLFKYRQLWFQRGFDVLIVRTTPIDSLLPPIGSIIVAKNVMKVLSDLNNDYKEMVVHGLSAGNYVFGEVCYLFHKSPEQYSFLNESIKGIIIDSLVADIDIPSGMSITITNNLMLQQFIEKTVSLYFKMFEDFTVKNYKNVENIFVQKVLKCPDLIFCSKDDVISKYENIETLVQKRISLQKPIQVKCWQNSKHVLHYKLHPQDYEEEVDRFLLSLDLKNYCKI